MGNNKKENNSNYVLIILFVFIILIVLLFSKKENNKFVQSNPDISLQEKCATQAKKTLDTYKEKYTNDGWDNNGNPAPTRDNFNQTNHFNQKENKCFTLLTYDFTFAGILNPNFIDKGETLFDAYENKELGDCIHSHRLNYDNFAEEYKDICYIGDFKEFISQEEYKNIVNQKMELN